MHIYVCIYIIYVCIYMYVCTNFKQNICIKTLLMQKLYFFQTFQDGASEGLNI